MALATPGLWALVSITFVAGTVFGFAGFGSALIFMPVAVALIPAPMAVAAMAVSEISCFVTVVPRAWGEVDKRAVLIMIAAAILPASVGIWMLGSLDLTVLRWGVITTAAVTLAALVAGWRYRTEPRLPTRILVGGASGLVGGATGLLGPVFVLFQLAGRDSVARSRATALVFLTVTSVLLLPLMALQGLLTPVALALGVVLLLPYGLGTWLGRMLFRPEHEGLYRGLAYVIIAGSILLGLPV